MAFEGLSSKLQNVFKKLGGKGKLSEKEVREAMREVKLALLEADVNFAVVKNFVNKVTERAVGSEVLESLTPAQQVIKIVNEELTALMGGTGSKIEFGSKSPSVILLAGLIVSFIISDIIFRIRKRPRDRQMLKGTMQA